MHTLIVSDLHLSHDGSIYDVFAGEKALPALLDHLAAPARVIVNGDGIDFLMNDDDGIELDRARAVDQACAIAEGRATRTVFQALGRVLQAGGEVVIRMGNHDVELVLPEVQEIFRAALDQPNHIAARLVFQVDDQPLLLSVGGARVLVTHGHEDDDWNRIDYKRLKKKADGFEYPPGSELVKRFMNPVVKEHRMRFVNLLKPDFWGGACTALAIKPQLLGLLLENVKASASILGRLALRGIGLSFGPDQAQDVSGAVIEGIAKDAELTAEERDALAAMLNSQALAFAPGAGVEPVPALRVKLARWGSKTLLAGLQKRFAGAAGETYFHLAPEQQEWNQARKLANKHHAGAVILGHTHATRWKADDSLVFVNTGTWIWLMELPAADAPDEKWVEFIDEIENNLDLSPEKEKLAKKLSRFTAARVEEHPEGGAVVSLVEWKGTGLEPLGSARVAAAL